MRSFGLSVTTLEEVFLKIASEDAPGASPESSPRASTLESLPCAPGDNPHDQASASPLDTQVQLQLNPQLLSPSFRVSSSEERRRPRVADPLNCPRRRGCGRWWCQFRACIVKHVRTTLRERWAAATQARTLLPLNRLSVQISLM